jgi:hypothetical protein
MRKLLYVPVLLALICSCQKSSDRQNSPSTDTRLISVRGYQNNTLERVDTFIYNANGSLLTQKEFGYGNAGSYADSFSVTFNYSGTNTEPVSYTINDGWGNNTYTLNYDNQGRVIKDTIIPDRASRASTFSYPNNNIVYTSKDNGSTDTLYLSGGNMVKTVQASIPADTSLTIITDYIYNQNYPNPFYYTGQTQNVRVLLTKIDGWEMYVSDCISKNCYTAAHENNNGFSAQYTHTTDGAGRVIKTEVLGYRQEYRYK